MTPSVIIDALEHQLDLAEQIVNWAMVLAVAVAWAGIQKNREIEAFHIKFDRRSAFFAISVVYILATGALAVLFLRIGDLLHSLAGSDLVEGVTTIATHPWLLNPFSYFGTGWLARAYSAEGFGTLIVVWWLCHASLSSLMDDKQHRRALAMTGLFLFIGLCAMLTIHRVYNIVAVKMTTANPQLAAALLDTAFERQACAFIGTGTGLLLFGAVNIAQARLFREHPAT
jgi:hypothetical protein